VPADENEMKEEEGEEEEEGKEENSRIDKSDDILHNFSSRD